MVMGGSGVVFLALAALVASERSRKGSPDVDQSDYHELQEPMPHDIPWFKPSVGELTEGGVLHDAVHSVKKAADLMKDVAGDVVDAVHEHEQSVDETKHHLDKATQLGEDLSQKVLAELIEHDGMRMNAMDNALKVVFPTVAKESDSANHSNVETSTAGQTESGATNAEVSRHESEPVSSMGSRGSSRSENKHQSESWREQQSEVDSVSSGRGGGHSSQSGNSNGRRGSGQNIDSRSNKSSGGISHSTDHPASTSG